jgi:acetyl/propionyl-CoA carboxylase alpha subunit
MKGYRIQRGNTLLELGWHGRGDQGRLDTPLGSFDVVGHVADGELTVHIGSRVFRVEPMGEGRFRVNGRELCLLVRSELEQRFADLGLGAADHAGGRVEVPMPGKVIAIEVAVGDTVTRGQGLVVVEAMKMENEVKAPCAGRITHIAVAPGAQLEKGALLLEIEPS